MSKSLFISLALLWAVAATAQDPASYQGPDRQERLVAGAKKEGEFVMYTSAQADDIGAVAKAFEQKYGVKVTMWRAGSEKVLQLPDVTVHSPSPALRNCVAKRHAPKPPSQPIA